ncbi:MAG: PAS-domain containing protein [Holosporales bacterium]|nr:PAS-domain containing protein [Holosporales bacterium]
MSRWRIKRLKTRLVTYEAVGETAQDGWAIWDVDQNFLGCSSSFRSLLGIATEKNFSFADMLVSFEEMSSLQEGLNILRRRGTFLLELTVRKTNLQVNVRGIHIIKARKSIFCLWLHDGTLNKRAETQWCEMVQEAERKHAHLLSFLDAIPLPIWHRRPGDLRLDYCNKTYADVAGVNVERVLLEDAPLIPGSAAQAKKLASDALKEKAPQQAMQNSVYHGKSRHHIVHETPFEEGTIGFSLDATESITAKGILERHMAAYVEIFDLLSTAIAIFNADMRLGHFNGAYVRLMGLNEKWLHTFPSFGAVLEELRLKRKLPEVVDFSAYKKEQISLFQTLIESRQDLMHLPNETTLRTIIAPHSLGGLLFLYEDVTDALTLERKYNTLIEVQKETIDRLNEGVSVFSSDNRLKLVNEACGNIWDMTPEDRTLGRHISDFVESIKSTLDYGEDWERFKDNVISNLTDRIPKAGRLLRKNNVMIDFMYTPLPDGTHLHTFVNVTNTCRMEKCICGRFRQQMDDVKIKSKPLRSERAVECV